MKHLKHAALYREPKEGANEEVNEENQEAGEAAEGAAGGDTGVGE